MLAHPEKFVRLPGDHTTRQSAPTPLHDATENLMPLAPHLDLSILVTHRGLRQQQLLAQTVPLQRVPPIGIEVIANKAPGGNGICRRSKGKEKEGHIQGWKHPRVSVIHFMSIFCCSLPGDVLPLDFTSCVHPRSSSWISSGSTVFRSHASSQRGFGGGSGAPPLACECFFDLERGPSRSLLRKTLEKNGMLTGAAFGGSYGTGFRSLRI